ncbi:hypothetical protein B0H17DRAFT_1158147 [Mycena rosella]|uniref:Uncharacterized protein n=1 Tax=Mycena rosella TaxID=1033263 RepID=A0AAD7DUN7_MYCRO|nr:hypothetical protein B0H17DRAFT_1158147 [Mycena rosella]
MASFNPYNMHMNPGQALGPNAAYLLGLGPMPPATNKQTAVARINAALDSGMFDALASPGPQRLSIPFRRRKVCRVCCGLETNTYYVDEVANITISLPVYNAKNTNDKGKKSPTVSTTLILPSDIPSVDFFSRVHALMNVDPVTAVLGWKESAERRRDPYHRLETPDDLNDAFKVLVSLEKSTRRKRPVTMELVNLEVQPDGKTTKQAEKDSEKAVTAPELRKVQEKLTCALHPGKNRWCYVMGPTSKHPGQHVPLGIDVVTLWARKVHDGEADEDCIAPPNILNLDELAEHGKAREDRGSRNRAQPSLPPIHVHVGGSDRALREVDGNIPGPASSKRPREDASDEDSSDDDTVELHIVDVLQELHQKFPALNYAKGIVYASSVLEFDKTYYKENVGMADGAIGKFIKKAGKMVKAVKKRNGKKRARVSDDDLE